MALVIHRDGKPNSLVCRRHARIGVFGGVGVSSKAIVNYGYHANPLRPRVFKASEGGEGG